MISLYAGTLTNPQLVRQQSNLVCPCYRIFSYLHGSTSIADNTLLLTDDRGSSQAVQYGLWSLDTSTTDATPAQILSEDSQQGPLALSPDDNMLLYSTYQGLVTVPTDGSVPGDVAALTYANSMSIGTLSGSPLTLQDTHVILAEQHNLSNTASYHWVTTPVFSPDRSTLTYVEFSSAAQPPYNRASSIWSVNLSTSGSTLEISKPVLVATSTAGLLELGIWFNNHVVTPYADGAIYAIDVQNATLAELAAPKGYLRLLGNIGTGGT
jgi:hypothetical protein